MAHLKKTKHSVNVLMVEDDQETSLATMTCLQAFGYKTDFVDNGKEALNWVEKNGHPDIILLDLNMPVMNGQEFMEEYQGPALIVVTTAWDNYELPCKPFDTLAKPYKVLDVIDSLERAVSALGSPLWMRLLPCDHKCVSVDIQNKDLILTCMVPDCGKRTLSNTDKLDFNTVLELTMALAEDSAWRSESASLS